MCLVYGQCDTWYRARFHYGRLKCMAVVRLNDPHTGIKECIWENYIRGTGVKVFCIFYPRCLLRSVLLQRLLLSDIVELSFAQTSKCSNFINLPRCV